MLYGCKLALPPVLYSLVSNQPKEEPSFYLTKLTSTLIKLHKNAFQSSEYICDTAHSQLKYGDIPYHLFKINDSVLYLIYHSGTWQVKLDALWCGPFTIIDKVGVDTYSIKDQKSGDIVNCVHAKFLKM